MLNNSPYCKVEITLTFNFFGIVSPVGGLCVQTGGQVKVKCDSYAYIYKYISRIANLNVATSLRSLFQDFVHCWVNVTSVSVSTASDGPGR